jgi:hypothetical protein
MINNESAMKENKSAMINNESAMKENKSAMINNESALKDNIMQVLEKNILQHDHDMIVIIQAGLPIYVLLLSGNNCLLYSSIGISFKSITK